jgi:glutathione peroxidase
MKRYKVALADVATALMRRVSALLRLKGGTTDVRPLSQSFYTVSATALDGRPVDFGRFAGKVTLVVNVASECGFTPQYAGLQALHEEISTRGFDVLGFPSHEFGGQEPGSAEEIRAFCDRRFGVTFPMFAKVQTRPGPGQSAVYARLGESGHLPNWNFYKFLVDRNGQVAAVFPTHVPPDARQLREAIERSLAEGPAVPSEAQAIDG